MSTTLTLHTAAAQALAAQLPTAAPLEAVHSPGGMDAPGAVYTATFIGSVSADLALSFGSVDPLASGATGAVSTADILRPAMEAAAAALGTGVLGAITEQAHSALNSDPDAAVFMLTDGNAVQGTFAVRVRETGTVSNGDSTSDITGKLGRINNVDMALTVVIGRTSMSVRDVLNLVPGAVIELDRSAGTPADVLLNGRLIARGEVVVVDQDYAVRITKILDVAESAN